MAQQGGDKKKNLASLFFGLVLVIFGGWLVYSSVVRAGEKEVIFESTSLTIEVPESSEAEARGLGGRESLAKNHGMLFTYESEAQRYFWMKDMKFSIDIIWIDDDQRVIDITKNLSPETYPERYTSSEPSQYVLEVNAGYSDEKGIEVGDKAIIRL
jgi:uncharacterized membrane protein (UPF0127 family)